MTQWLVVVVNVRETLYDTTKLKIKTMGLEAFRHDVECWVLIKGDSASYRKDWESLVEDRMYLG